MTTTHTYHSIEDIRLGSSLGMLWLASWYPSVTAPTNGDFIQRHAIALSSRLPLVVVHAIHDDHCSEPLRYEVKVHKSLTEIIIYFRHSGDVKSIRGKLTYNWLFYRYTQQLVDHLITHFGKPAGIHVHVPVKMGRVAQRTSRRWKIPYVVSEQSSKYLPGIEDGFDKRNWFYRSTVKSVFKHALAISNVSRSVGMLIGAIAGRNDIQVIRNVADPGIFRYIPLDAPRFRFIHASTLKRQKNFQGILNVFSRLAKAGTDFELTVLGGEEEGLAQIRKQYSQAPWLKLEGTVDHGKVAGYMQMANCLVMFSRDENFPCVIVEALCCGLPVITSDAGGCGEAIEAGNGIVVKAGDEDQLHEAIIFMLNNYKSYNREEIADRAASLYGNDQIAADFIQFYRNAGIMPVSSL